MLVSHSVCLHLHVEQSSEYQIYFQVQTSFHHDNQHGFIRSVENVILTDIVHTADVWQIRCHADNMTDSKAM